MIAIASGLVASAPLTIVVKFVSAGSNSSPGVAVDDGAAGLLDGRLDDVAQRGAVVVVEDEDADVRVHRHRGSGCRAPRPGPCPAGRSGSRSREYPDRSVAVFAGEIWTISAPVMSSITLSVTDDDAAPMMTETSWLMRSVTDCVATSAWSASEESVCSTVDVGAQDAAGLVDLLDRQVDAGDLGRAEEGERTGLREQRADDQRARRSRRRRRPSRRRPRRRRPLSRRPGRARAAPARAAARTACVDRFMRGTPL